jgi:hypothetical protein
MVGTESVSGCKYGGNRERVSVYMEGTERVSGCIPPYLHPLTLSVPTILTPTHSLYIPTI